MKGTKGRKPQLCERGGPSAPDGSLSLLSPFRISLKSPYCTIAYRNIQPCSTVPSSLSYAWQARCSQLPHRPRVSWSRINASISEM